MELPDLPEGWRMKSLSEEDGFWKIFAYAEGYWCCAGGTSPRYAMLDAIKRIEDGMVWANMTGGKMKDEEVNVLSYLKIEPKKSEFKRRF
jgi:hypothetical protein